MQSQMTYVTDKRSEPKEFYKLFLNERSGKQNHVRERPL